VELTVKSGHNTSQGESKMLKRGSTILSMKLFKLTIGGGVAFWAFTIAFSLLPMMAEFRAALSIPYISGAIVEPLLGGMIISCCVSYFLLRFFDRIPPKNPILKSVILTSSPSALSLSCSELPQVVRVMPCMSSSSAYCLTYQGFSFLE